MVRRIMPAIGRGLALGLILMAGSMADSAKGWAQETSSSLRFPTPLTQKPPLRVGVKDNLRPLGFRDSQGEWQGLEIALARRLALALFGSETAVEFVPLKNQDRLAALLTGQVDCVIAHLTQNAARERLVDFSPVYYRDGIGVISLTPLDPQSLTQARLAVLQGSGAIAVIRANYPQAVLVGVESYDQGKGLVDRGEVQGFVGDDTVLTGWAQQNAAYFHKPLFLTVAPLAIALPKGLQHEAFRQQVNQTLLQLQSEGWFRHQWQRWGLPF